VIWLLSNELDFLSNELISISESRLGDRNHTTRWKKIISHHITWEILYISTWVDGETESTPLLWSWGFSFPSTFNIISTKQMWRRLSCLILSWLGYTNRHLMSESDYCHLILKISNCEVAGQNKTFPNRLIMKTVQITKEHNSYPWKFPCMGNTSAMSSFKTVFVMTKSLHL
jgi:hypothetical protein